MTEIQTDEQNKRDGGREKVRERQKQTQKERNRNTWKMMNKSKQRVRKLLKGRRDTSIGETTHVTYIKKQETKKTKENEPEFLLVMSSTFSIGSLQARCVV